MDKIAILDAGSQFCKIIDKKLRGLQCETDILPIGTDLNKIYEYKGVIISGGPDSVYNDDAPKCNPNIFSLDIPILGICYGMQLMCYHFGCCVQKSDKIENSQTSININIFSELFKGLEGSQKVLLTHSDKVDNPLKSFQIIGTSDHCVAAVKHRKYPYYGLQFHPEVDLTPNGDVILKNFLDICGIEGRFTIDNRLNNLMDDIKSRVSDKKIIVLMSGGVDSTVTCKLLTNIFGKNRVHGIFIDTGFMRKNEPDDVFKTLSDEGLTVEMIKANDEFLNGSTIINGKRTEILTNVTKPEIKRKIIGDTFMKIIDKILNDRFRDGYLLAQGTLRPDLIESASKYASTKANTIKTHHNDTELVRKKRDKGLIIEPLKDYHKDEVRIIGEKLGLSYKIVNRQPFPGPGLAIRIICAKKLVIDEKYMIAEDQLNKFISKNKFDFEIKATLLPIKSVGLRGDSRVYSPVVLLTCEYKDLKNIDWMKIDEFAKRIPEHVTNISRVVIGISSELCNKQIQKWNFVSTLINKKTLTDLKDIDNLINNTFREDNLFDKFNQMPIVLLPISFDDSNLRSIVLRPFITNDFMTGKPAIPNSDIDANILYKISDLLIKKGMASRVLYDLSSKPPGTTEWE